MEVIYSSLLGIVQGITELLPISSSGHLIFITSLFDKEPTRIILTTLHLASALALVLLYWNDLIKIVRSDKRLQFLYKIIVASIPVVFVGVLFGDKLEDIFYSYKFISLNLIFWGLIMIITERYEKKLRKEQNEEITIKNAAIIGLFQTLSLLPGTSRSGISTMAGIWSGAKKDKALDFSFMVGIPLLFGAFFFSVLKDGSATRNQLDPNLIGAFVLAFVSSYFAAFLLRKISKQKFLTFFGIYRIILGTGVFLLFTYFL